MQFFTWLSANYETIISIIVASFGVAIPIAMLIPGEHPDKEFTAIRDFIVKFSKK